MQKIISLFKRDYEGTRRVFDEVVEGAEWVLAGEGIATRKWDGTCCRIHNGVFYRRHVVKEGREVPPGWIHWDDDPQQRSGHGWLPVGDHPSDQWHREGLLNTHNLVDGTYELCGPKIQKNPEGFEQHFLVPHGRDRVPHMPRNFDGIEEYLAGTNVEGIVWHHPDGRMAKIKGKDFGLKRRA